jgi:rod shape-determining protein MreC
MSGVRFNQVFFGLMALSFLCAFVLPPKLTDIGRTQFSALLIPLSRPSYRLANAIRNHFQPPQAQDTRPVETIEQENVALKQQIQRLSSEIEQLRRRAGERESLGNLESLCERFSVTGADGDNREGLTIGGILGDVRINQPVLSSGTVVDVIGRINREGSVAAHVQLVTDAGFTVTGHFVSYSLASGAQENGDLLAIARGHGGGAMEIDNLFMEDVRKAHVQMGDWVVLRDETWPAAVQGVRIGRVASIEPLNKENLFAEIKLAPETSLMYLNDVWVMTR